MVFAPRETAASIGWRSRAEKDNHTEEQEKKDNKRKQNISQTAFQEDSKKKRVDGSAHEKGEGLNKEHGNEFPYSCDLNQNYCKNRAYNLMPQGVEILHSRKNERSTAEITFDYLGRDSHGISSQTIALLGKANVKATNGSIEILGYTLTAKSGKMISINSPSWMSSLCITPIYEEQNIEKEFNTKLKCNILNNSIIKVEITSLSETEETFQLEPLVRVRSHTVLPHGWKNAAEGIFSPRKGENTATHKAQTYHTQTNAPAPVSNHKNFNETKHRRRVLVCGAKGVGKSTYVRYLTNRFLCDESSQSLKDKFDVLPPRGVVLLDCDVGQPELSPPGLLSLSIVDKPILSPPHAHIICGGDTNPAEISISNKSAGKIDNTDKNTFAVSKGHCQAYYYGHTSSKADPTYYVATLRRLVADFEKIHHSDELPLIVNTDGWVKGMGNEILSSIINEVDPHYIVQIIGSVKSKQFTISDHDALEREVYVVEAYSQGTSSNCTSRVSSPISDKVDKMMDDTDQYSKVVDASPQYNDNRFHDLNVPVTSISLRNLRLCTYFLGGYASLSQTGAIFQNGIVDNKNKIATTLAAMKPFVVPFDSVELILPDIIGLECQSFDSMAQAVNGCIVGLCICSSTSESIHQCVGLGLIRGVDSQRKLLYILTPVSAQKLKGRVNTLVCGQIRPPFESIFLGLQSESFPFQCCDGISLGICRSNSTGVIKDLDS